MGILTWILFGLVAGVLAKLVMPGNDPGGIIVTILLGIAGSFVGGYIATLLGFGSVTEVGIPSLLAAVAGGVMLLAGYRLLRSKR